MSAVLFDLAAYLRRIGFDAREPLAPTFDVLCALVTHHTRVLPFENIEVLAGGVPKLDLAALQDKLVGGGRGGYCFEQNGLFMAALLHIGFTVRAREARVRAGVPTARTHMALQVSVAGGEYLVDVGFGGLAPLAPLRLHEAGEQAAGSGTYRFIEQVHDHAPGDLLMQTLLHEGWSDCYVIGTSAPTSIDFVMGNWFVATHPGGFLRNHLLVGRARQGGARLTLFNDKLELRQPQTAAPEERRLTTRAEFADVLADGFGLRPCTAELDAVMAAVERRAGT